MLSIGLIAVNTLLTSYDNPWSNTEQKTELICRDIKPKDVYGANEFIYNNKICQWIIVVKKPNDKIK